MENDIEKSINVAENTNEIAENPITVSPEGVLQKAEDSNFATKTQAQINQEIENLKDQIERIKIADSKVQDANLRGIPLEAVADDISMYGESIEKRKLQISNLKNLRHIHHKKNWFQKAVVTGGMFLASLFATKDASGQNEDSVGNINNHSVVSLNKEAIKLYDSKYYTPGSKEYNPLKVFQDLSLEFHPENIDSADVSILGGKDHPLIKEIKKIKKITISEFSLFPQDYDNFESFRDVFVRERSKEFSDPRSIQQSNLNDAYFHGKAIYYRNLLNKYENNFNKFKEDKPKEAGFGFSDMVAGLMYNQSEDIDYSSEQDFNEAIKNWRESAQDVMDRLWDFEYQKDHLEEEALKRWQSYEKNKPVSPDDKSIKI